MKQIVITISVPDGVNVDVRQGSGGSGGGDKPFVKRPDPDYPEHDPACRVHGEDWKLVPGGTSKKTGKPYNAFWACPTQGCNEKPEFKRDHDDALPF